MLSVNVSKRSHGSFRLSYRESQTVICMTAKLLFTTLRSLRSVVSSLYANTSAAYRRSFSSVIICLTTTPFDHCVSPSLRRFGPALIPHRVQGFRTEAGKTNEVEAEEIA